MSFTPVKPFGLDLPGPADTHALAKGLGGFYYTHKPPQTLLLQKHLWATGGLQGHLL